MAKRKAPTDAALAELRAYGLAFPGAHPKRPWPGHDDLAVDDKTFAYLSLPGEPLRVGCKLPRSAAMALMVPGATPMAYGLGKRGWVTVTFAGPDVPLAMLKAWLDESYRAQAPKKLVKLLAAPPSPPPPTAKPRSTPRAKAAARRRPASR